MVCIFTGVPTGNLHICMEDDCSHEDIHVKMCVCWVCSVICVCHICCNWCPKWWLLVTGQSTLVSKRENVTPTSSLGEKLELVQ